MPGFGSAPPKVAEVQGTVPLSVLMTHLSFTPKETWRAVVPTLQLPPSSAHLEKPEGQSTACAAPIGATAPTTTAMAASPWRGRGARKTPGTGGWGATSSTDASVRMFFMNVSEIVGAIRRGHGSALTGHR